MVSTKKNTPGGVTVGETENKKMITANEARITLTEAAQAQKNASEEKAKDLCENVIDRAIKEAVSSGKNETWFFRRLESAEVIKGIAERLQANGYTTDAYASLSIRITW